ncbi:MAG TPA: alpha/beta hydrolase [Actinomycetota bacterium]|nr:alpha/beta hydrolase [Actinomycetota bacterium]
MQTRAVVFRSDDLTLEGQIVIPEQPRAALLLCHGIPGGGPPDPDDEGYEGFARAMASAGYAAMWLNFRGCRGAPGEFSMSGWCTDIEGALDAIAKLTGIGDLPRILIGSSAGGSAAIVVAASRDDVVMIATLAAPASLAQIGDDKQLLLQRLRNIGIIHDPAYPPNVDDWWADLIAKGAETAIAGFAPHPLLLIHGDTDQIVPYHHAERLFTLAGEPKELVRIPGGAHQLRRDQRALDALTDWLDRRLARRAAGQSGQVTPQM